MIRPDWEKIIDSEDDGQHVRLKPNWIQATKAARTGFEF